MKLNIFSNWSNLSFSEPFSRTLGSHGGEPLAKRVRRALDQVQPGFAHQEVAVRLEMRSGKKIWPRWRSLLSEAGFYKV